MNGSLAIFAGLFGLLARPVEHFLELFLVFTRVGDEHAGRRQVRIIATEHGNREAPCGSSTSSLKLTPIRSFKAFEASSSRTDSSSRKSLRPGSFQSWPYWLLRNDSRNDLTSFNFSRKSVLSGSIRSGGAAALAERCGQTRHTNKSQPSDEGQATNRPLRHLHVRKLHFQASLGSPGE